MPARAEPPGLPGVAADVETIRFDDPRWAPVRLLRGAAAPRPPVEASVHNTETVTFGERRVAVVRGPRAENTENLHFAGGTVAVVRGPRAPEPTKSPVPEPRAPETVQFADARLPAVTVLRGAPVDTGPGLFDPGNGGELDRVAFAVDGVESGHGANPAMWRPDFDGPQGPMQVSAAAALHVGGGDRFDPAQNRRLGRAFLAAMHRRYGNWPDALAAYNWGPAHLDQWIVEGRPPERLPEETRRYLALVLRDALLVGPGR